MADANQSFHTGVQPPAAAAPARMVRRSEAKAFFANERTFLHWMNVSVTVGSIAAALLGVSGHAHKHWGDTYTQRAIAVRIIALSMLAMSIFMACFATFNFYRRMHALINKLDGPYDNRLLPFMLSGVMIVSLAIVFAGTVANFAQH